MRKIVLIFYLFSLSMIALANNPDVIERLKLIPTTSLPYFEGKDNMRSSRYFFNPEALYPIPIYYYKDIGCTEKEMSPMPLGADIFRRYEITHGNYTYLAALEISESDFSHTYLATFDMYGNVIDYLSVDVGFAANFGVVSQDAGNDLHLQLLCKQQTRAGMAQHMATAGRQIQGRSLQQISKSLFHLARCSGLPVGCGDHIAV